MCVCVCVEAHLARELAARGAFRLRLSSFCPVVNLAVALIAHVMLSPRTQPQNCICSVADGDKCKDMIAADGGKVGGALLDHRKAGVSHRCCWTLGCNHHKHADAMFHLWASHHTRSDLLHLCIRTVFFFCFVFMIWGLCSGCDASPAWRRLEIKTGERRGDSRRKKKKSRKDNKGDGASWQCPLRKGPPSALVQLYSTTHACFPYLTHFSDSVQIKLHSSSVCHEGMGPFTGSCCSKSLFKIYLFIYLLVSLTSLS